MITHHIIEYNDIYNQTLLATDTNPISGHFNAQRHQKEKMKQKQRIPRPLGTTYLSLQYQREPTKDFKAKLRKHLLKAFIQGQIYHTYLIPTSLNLKPTKNKKVNNKTKYHKPIHNKLTIKECRRITLEDLGLALGLSVVKMQLKLERILALEAKGIDSKVNQANHEKATRAIFFGTLNKALNRYPTMTEWADELQAVARLYKYAPLNVKEATSAFGTELSYLKTIADLASKMLPQQTTQKQLTLNQQFNNSTMPENINGHYLTATTALQMLEEKGLCNPDQLNLNLIALTNGIMAPDAVDVKAIPSDAQGVKAFNPKDFIYADHGTRREHELGTEVLNDVVPDDEP